MPKRPRDPNQLAKLIVDIATGEVEDTVSELHRHPPENVRGRAGGAAGGKARSEALLPSRRSAIAKKAAKARWSKH
jgi:hypothetical protein